MAAAVLALASEGVWLDQTSFSSAEELYYCKQYGTAPQKRPKSPGPVKFDQSANKPRHQNQPQHKTNGHQPRYNNQHGQNYNGNGGYNGGYYNGQQQQQGGYYRNPSYYNQVANNPQFGEIKQHIAQARQTIQRALRHSGNRNSGGSWNGNRNSGSRNSGSWNHNGRNSGSEWNRRNSGGGGRQSNDETRRKRTVSFEDSNGDLSIRIKQLESENDALHKLTGSLESQIAVLLERVNKLESADTSSSKKLSNGV